MPSHKLKRATPLLMLLLAACGASLQQGDHVESQHGTTSGPARLTDLSPFAIEALLNETAEQLSTPLSEEGKGHSYYTHRHRTRRQSQENGVFPWRAPKE